LTLSAIDYLWTHQANLKPAERGYLLYYAKGLYERAMYLSGAPMTIDVKVKYEDIDLAKIGAWLSDTFPLGAPADEGARQIH
jgi:hypothetical protein